MTAERNAHEWLTANLETGEPDNAEEIRQRCRRAKLSELADGFIHRGLSTSAVELALIDAMAAGQGRVAADFGGEIGEFSPWPAPEAVAL